MTAELGPFSLDEEWPRPKGCTCRTLRQAEGCENWCHRDHWVSPRRLAFSSIDAIAVGVVIAMVLVGVIYFARLHF